MIRGSLERIVVFISVCACISLFFFFSFTSLHNDYVDTASFIGLQSPGLLAEFSSDINYELQARSDLELHAESTEHNTDIGDVSCTLHAVSPLSPPVTPCRHPLQRHRREGAGISPTLDASSDSPTSESLKQRRHRRHRKSDRASESVQDSPDVSLPRASQSMQPRILTM